jgi:hypothetical protein
MDSILFSRLRNYVVTQLGPEFHTDVSKLVVTVMTFIENKVNTDLEGSEKLQLLISWLNQLLSSVGVTLPPDTLQLIISFVDRICEATKSVFEINTTPPPVVQQLVPAVGSQLPAQVPVPAKRSSSFKLSKKA